jgi:AcrR family transcriptional regulator
VAQNPVMTARPAQPGSNGEDGSRAPRERILIAATALFGRHGTARTGVDTIIAEAGVAKATFYRHFPSKEALLVAWLRSPQTRWFDHVRAAVERQVDGAGPAELGAGLFIAIARWLEAGEYSGCPYLKFAVETADSAGQRSAQECRAYLEEIRSYFQSIAGAAGHSQPGEASHQLQASLAGGITLGVAHRTSRYLVAASEIAREILEPGAGVGR